MKDLQSVINKLIGKSVVGCGTYTNNNSLWLIFTDKKEWVIELTSTGSLWYNYYFFQKIFKVLGLDVIENQVYITKWVEDTIQNGVRDTTFGCHALEIVVEDTIQNGVRDTQRQKFYFPVQVEDTIENGVRHTMWSNDDDDVEDAIQNGVRITHTRQLHQPLIVEDAIQNGVKFVSSLSHYPSAVIEHTIENGVKYTGGLGKTKWLINKIKDTIQNGIKNNQII